MSATGEWLRRGQALEFMEETYRITRKVGRKILATLKSRELAPNTWPCFRKSQIEQILEGSAAATHPPGRLRPAGTSAERLEEQQQPRSNESGRSAARQAVKQRTKRTKKK